MNTFGFGGNAGMPRTSTTRTLEFTNELSLISPAGAHRWALGFYGNKQDFDQDATTNRFGTFMYNSLSDFENNLPASFTRTLVPSIRSGGVMNEAVYLSDAWRPRIGSSSTAGNGGGAGGGGGGFGGGGFGGGRGGRGGGGFGGGPGAQRRRQPAAHLRSSAWSTRPTPAPRRKTARCSMNSACIPACCRRRPISRRAPASATRSRHRSSRDRPSAASRRRC